MTYAAVDWNTQRGVFGPRGRGGGVFSPALGAVNPFANVPASCWDEFGFKGCSEAASKSANDSLYTMLRNGDIDFQPGSSQWADSYNRMWADGLESCKKQFCGVTSSSVSASEATTTDMRDLPMGKYDSLTKMLQQQANNVLAAAGMKTIATDGILGPNTCAAISFVIRSGKISGWVMPRACPAGAGASTTAKSPTTSTQHTPTTSPTQTAFPSQTSSGRTKVVAVAGVAMLAVGLGLIFYKPKRSARR